MGLQLFGDFSFSAGEDTAANPYQDRQQCINWYVEAAASPAAKEVVGLLGCPGLIQLSGQTLPALGSTWPQPSAITSLPVRGMHVLPGSNTAICVIGNTCYVVTIVSMGSSTTPAQITIASVGNLKTYAGPVSIRDLGVQGGAAIIVDGPYGYWYVFNANATIASVGAFVQIADPAFLGAVTVAEIDGWLILNQPGTALFYTNALPYATSFNASLFALKDASSDILIGVYESKEELWLVGAQTTEIWYDAGNPYFAFQRLVGTMLQVGCKAPYSISRLSSEGQDGLIWFGRSERGENVFVRTQGFGAQTVSTPAISDAIAKYTMTSDAVSYTYQEDGHEFYVTTFPTADRTWVYDATLPPPLAWHQRLSYDPYAGQFHRHRSNCYMNFAGNRIVGDYQNGCLYQLTRAAYTDAGWPIRAIRRSAHIWNKENRERVFLGSLQVDFAPGQGQSTGLGANPQATLRLSRDGGTTFGPDNQASMGSIGMYQNRAIWRRLGFARDAVAEIEVIAPVNRDIVGATLRAFGP